MPIDIKFPQCRNSIHGRNLTIWIGHDFRYSIEHVSIRQHVDVINDIHNKNTFYFCKYNKSFPNKKIKIKFVFLKDFFIL
nr:MAG TPA: hypothetical protein [Bacteriophage sp.]